MEFGGVPLGDVSSWTLNAVFFLSVVTGGFVPRKTYIDMRDERNAERAARVASEKQNHDLIVASSKVAAKLLEALPSPKESADELV